MAEVLITLGVIGVVAAVTMPTLIQKHQEQRRVTQVKKAYSQLSQAFLMAVNEYGPVENWGFATTYTGLKDEDGNDILDTSGEIMVADIFRKYLKESGQNEHTFKRYLSLDGRNYNSSGSSKITNNNGYTIFLADGTIVTFGWVLSGCPSNNCGDIEVFLPESIAKLGVSTFWFHLTPQGIKPYGHQNDFKTFEDYCDITNSAGLVSNAQGRGCTAWVIYNGNMDYLHCYDKLGWDKAQSCK